MKIGSRIRKFRKSQARTLQEIADACQCSRSLLSKIETGTITPSLGSLQRIASALGVEMSALMDEKDDAGTVYLKKNKIQKSKMVSSDKSFSFYGFASERVNKAMTPYYFVAQKSEIKSKPISHQGEEFVFMLKGTMRFQVGDIEYILRPGDSLYFDASEVHTRDPVSDNVEYLLIMADTA